MVYRCHILVDTQATSHSQRPDAGQPARVEGVGNDLAGRSNITMTPNLEFNSREGPWLGEDESTWTPRPEGAYNSWGSEGPGTMSRPASLREIEIGVPINIWLVSGSPVSRELHGMQPELILTEKADPEVVTLALARLASRHLGVPEDCFSFTWKVQIAMDNSCAGYDVTMIMVALDDQTWERLDEERHVQFEQGGSPYCYICMRDCEDADSPNPRGATPRSNCIECEPCFLCERCSVSTANGTNFCLSCLPKNKLQEEPQILQGSELIRYRLLTKEDSIGGD